MIQTRRARVTWKLQSSRRAFSLIEVIVVIAVMALLISLLVPALQAVRSTARRLQCQSNLRQLSQGLHQYHEVHGTLPPWTITVGVDCGNDGALTLIFPFIELPRKCDAIAGGLQRVRLLECPADGDIHSFKSPLSYCVNVSPGESAGSRASGPFAMTEIPGRPLVKLSDISDGTSQTACISEQVAHRAGGDVRVAEANPQRYFWRVTIPPVSAATVSSPMTPAALAERASQTELSISDCYNGPRTWSVSSQASCADWRQSNNNWTTYSHWLRPNGPTCGPDNLALDNPFLLDHRGAASEHSGGLNVAYLDGHVRFVGNSVDTKVWRAVGTRDGAEVVGEGAY